MIRSLLTSFKRADWLHWPPLIVYIVVFLLFFARAFIYLDPDFGWHLSAGNYFIHHGFPSTDIFTYTASNFPWVSHEWLHDIFVYLVYGMGGFPLLAGVFALLWTAAVWGIGRKMPTVLVLIATFSLLPFSGVRTLTWSVLLLVALVRIVQLRKGKYTFVLPLLFLVWANLHGSFVVGFIYVLYQALKTRSVKLGVITLTCIAVTFINPYGYHLYGEIFSTLTDSSLRGRILEWQSFFIPPIAYPYLMTWVVVTAYRMRQVWRQWRRYVRIDILFFLASVSQARQLPLFVIVSLPYTARGIAAIAAMIPKELDRPRKRFITVLATAFAIGTIACGIWSFHDVSPDRESVYPVQAAAYLQQHPCSGNIFNSYNYGGYLIWKVPGKKVYIDGRMPSWSYHGEKYLDNYVHFLSDEQYRTVQIKKYAISCVLLGNEDQKTIDSLKTHGWKSIVKDTHSVLLEKK